MIGSDESTPSTTPARSAGAIRVAIKNHSRARNSDPSSVVVLQPQVRDELFSSHVPERVLQLHQLNEQIVLRVQLRRVLGALEVEREPLLDAVHAGALREIHEQR